MPNFIDVNAITTLQKQKTQSWQQQAVDESQQGFLQLVEKNHSFNFQLWYEEDKARRDDMGFEYVYQAKRKIDDYNQARNNMIEAMDEYLYRLLQPKQPDECAVNSETPGMIIDRLSILALKEYNMHKQTERNDVDESHRAQCQQKLDVIGQQLEQLSQCLKELLAHVSDGSRTFRLYHQFKMYNDPTLNPQLYENAG